MLNKESKRFRPKWWNSFICSLKAASVLNMVYEHEAVTEEIRV